MGRILGYCNSVTLCNLRGYSRVRDALDASNATSVLWLYFCVSPVSRSPTFVKKLRIMPHSTVSAPMLCEGLVEEDSILPDAPEQVPDFAKGKGNLDMIDGPLRSEESTGEAPKTDVKLEDLFNDVDDDQDDEFSDSIFLNNKEITPLEAPL